jgi:hypothetical protein
VRFLKSEKIGKKSKKSAAAYAAEQCITEAVLLTLD